MHSELIKCWRCKGRKKVYTVGAGYSLQDCGGPEIVCPLCNGEGQIVPRPSETKKIVKKRKSTSKKDQKVVVDDAEKHD